MALSMTILCYHAECPYAECPYAECPYAEYPYAECPYAVLNKPTWSSGDNSDPSAKRSE
jgi:hypothetical protein